MKVTLADIEKARQVIQPHIDQTVCDYSRAASKIVGTDIYLKLENTQRTGSFKIRGASYKISTLTESEKKAGVIACSAGNHAQGVALSSSTHNIKSVIVMPVNAPLAKIEATKNYGSEVILFGSNIDESKEYSYQLAKEKGYTFIHPYEDEQVIAGQGTLGLEILEQISDLDSVVIPLGGGGLISGVAVALKSINPKIKIYGVQTAAIPTMSQLFHTKSFEEIPSKITTFADGIAIRRPSQKIFDSFISKYVDDIVTVTEGQIAEAIVFLMERVKTVAEGSGAVALAAAFNCKMDLGKKTCLFVCGGNVDLNTISGAIQHGQIQRGRLCELSVIMPDIPGSLSLLTKILAEEKANILEVHHDRIGQDLGMKETKIDFVLETINHDHILKIRESISKIGARFAG